MGNVFKAWAKAWFHLILGALKPSLVQICVLVLHGNYYNMEY